MAYVYFDKKGVKSYFAGVRFGHGLEFCKSMYINVMPFIYINIGRFDILLEVLFGISIPNYIRFSCEHY